MIKAKVVIEIEQFNNDRSTSDLRLHVDGELIDVGQIGGEPEDNIESRDYAWVKGMLSALAVRLGADVTIEYK